MPIRPENRRRYPPYWRQLSRMIRFGRGQGKCERCGEAHGAPSTQTGSIVVLTTAHLYNHAPESCGFGNLAGLCQLCHLRIDRPRHIANRKANARQQRLEREPEMELRA
ncbi:MAG: hypothetical protein AB7O44_32325 [Hyphomicrobiaceae bacterium]